MVVKSVLVGGGVVPSNDSKQWHHAENKRVYLSGHIMKPPPSRRKKIPVLEDGELHRGVSWPYGINGLVKIIGNAGRRALSIAQIHLTTLTIIIKTNEVPRKCSIARFKAAACGNKTYGHSSLSILAHYQSTLLILMRRGIAHCKAVETKRVVIPNRNQSKKLGIHLEPTRAMTTCCCT
jgi:hypothetical protein